MEQGLKDIRYSIVNQVNSFNWGSEIIKIRNHFHIDIGRRIDTDMRQPVQMVISDIKAKTYDTWK